MYYIIKTEPKDYSIVDLARDKKTIWNGVMNPQAVKSIQSWKPGDKLYIYHSGERCIAGLAEVSGHPYQSSTNPRSFEAEIRYIKTFPPPERVTLQQFKDNPDFAEFSLVRQGRLSVIPCPDYVVKWLRDKDMA